MTAPIYRIVREWGSGSVAVVLCEKCGATERYWTDAQAAKWKHAHTAGCPGHQPTDRNPVDSAQFQVSADGDHVDISVDCTDLTPAHVVRVSFKRLWEITSTCRARQLGVDGRGGL